GLTAAFGQDAHPTNIARPFGYADHAARIQQVEQMARLDALVESRQREVPGEQRSTFVFGIGKMTGQHHRIRHLKIVRTVFAFSPEEHVPISYPRPVEIEIEYIFQILDIHGQTLEAV